MCAKDTFGNLWMRRGYADYPISPQTGKSIQLGQFSKGSPATLVMFLACHCKYVVLYKVGPVAMLINPCCRAVDNQLHACSLRPQEEIAALVKLYQGKGVSVIAISSSSIETHPQDGPSNMVGDVDKFGGQTDTCFAWTMNLQGLWS